MSPFHFPFSAGFPSYLALLPILRVRYVRLISVLISLAAFELVILLLLLCISYSFQNKNEHALRQLTFSVFELF